MRIAWVDNAKAIAILLVVFGHTKGISGTLCKRLIYSFHMPLFFLLSGYLLKERYLAESFKSFTLRNFRRLVIPYVSFWVLSYLIWLPTQSFRTASQKFAQLSFFDPFWGLLLGLGPTLYPNEVLWFYTCLFCTASIFYWVSKLHSKTITMTALAFLGLLGPLFHGLIAVRLPWNFELSLMACVFYGLGHILSEAEGFQLIHLSKTWLFAVPALCAILFLIVGKNGFVNMNWMQFGNPFLFYLGAFCGIGLTILIAQIWPKNIFCEWLSRSTIVVFSLHKIIFNVFTGVMVVVFGMEISFRESVFLSCLYTLGVLVVCYPTSFLLNKYFPWMIGRRKVAPEKALISIPSTGKAVRH